MFATHAESIAFRERLPHSRGLLDDSGNVIKDSEVEANLQIEKLNMVVIEQAEKLDRLACGIKSDAPGSGGSISAPMYTGEEPVEGVTLTSGV
jgi:hypothetical protein